MPENLVSYREKLFCVGKSRGDTLPKMEIFRRLVKKTYCIADMLWLRENSCFIFFAHEVHPI